MGTCAFCDIFPGTATGPPVAYDDGSFAVLRGRLQPTGPGYALVVPKQHIADLHHLAPEALGPTMEMVRRVPYDADAAVRGLYQRGYPNAAYLEASLTGARTFGS